MPNETRIVAEPNTRTIVLMRSFAAPRSRVFKAWTRPEHIACWWDPRGVHLAECEMDFRRGGAFRWVHRDAPGSGHAFTGIFREIAPPERLVLETPMLIGTLVFAEVQDGTEMTLTLECRTVQERDHLLKIGVDQGTARTLANLERYVESHAIAIDSPGQR